MDGFKPYIVKTGSSVERRNQFIRTNSPEYRLSVIQVFRKTLLELKGTELGKPKRVLEEMATFSEELPSELEERFKNKLDNVKRGNSGGLDDPEFFELIENFVWKHRPENIQALKVALVVKQLGSAMSVFISPNEYDRELAIRFESGLEHVPTKISNSGVEALEEGLVYRAAYLMSFDQEPVTWDELAGRFKYKTTQSQSMVDYSFFAIKKLVGKPYDLAISFSDDGADIHYGLHLPDRYLMLLKSFRTNFPVYVDYSQSTKNSYGKLAKDHPRSHTVIKNYLEPLEHCEDDPFYSKPSVVAFAKQRAKEIFTNFGF